MIIEKRGLTYKEILVKDAKPLILENHYSKSWGATFGTINIGVFKEGILKGVAVFGWMKTSRSYIKYSDHINQNQILELNRMWIDDELGRNSESSLLSASFKIIKKTRPYIKLINTFSDGRLGCGIVYQASNFKYYGKTSTLFYRIKGEERIYHTQIISITREGPFSKLNRAYCEDKLESFEVDTYNYIYALYSDWWNKIKLEQQTPPKEYERELFYKPIKKQPLNQLIKAMMISKNNNDNETFNIIRHYIKINRGLTDEEIKEKIIENLKSTQQFRKKMKKR